MKKAIFRFLCICVLSTGLFAGDVLLEGTAAYYYPTSSRFREIYSESGIYGLELSAQAWRGLYVWGSGNVFSKSGRMSGYNTRITFVPVGVGLKYFWKVKSVDLYLGAGALPTYANIHDHSPYVISSISTWGIGVIAKAGAIFNLPRCFFLDAFTNYSYIHVSNSANRGGTVTPLSANLSGFSFGAGLGYRFR